MFLERFSRATGGAKGALIALLALAAFGLVNPSASAQVTLNYSISGTTGAGNTSGTQNDITYTVNSTATDATTGSNVSTTTINTSNNGSTEESITINVTVSNFTFNGAAFAGEGVVTNMVVSATGGNPHSTSDAVTMTSSTAGNSLGTISGTQGQTGTNTNPYTLTPSSVTNNITVGLAATPFQIFQSFTVTLDPLDTGTFSIQTSATPTGTVFGAPEPSSFAIAGVGALGLIGFGLRRRKALGA
jgi:hypothetical protein